MTGREELDPFEHDDAAYVLGSLSDAERAAFEAHLVTCTACARRVQELSGLPAILSGLLEQDVRGLDTPDRDARSLDPRGPDLTDPDQVTDAGPVPNTLLPGLLRRAGATRRRRRWLVGGLAGVAAASLLALVLVLAPFSGSHPADGQAVAMTALTSTPVTATATLQQVPWGTRIVVECRYAVDPQWSQGVSYSLQAVDRSGNLYDLGSWSLGAGTTMTFTSGTSLAQADLAGVQVTLPDGTPILRLTT